MLLALFLAVVLIAAPSPTTTPASAPPPEPQPQASGTTTLQEIGHVYSNGLCTAIVTRANSAISTTLRNDQTITLTVATLRSVDLDSDNRLVHIRGLKELEHYANDLRLSAVRASGQVQELRKLAAESTDPVRKEDLKEFADALGGALQRQKRIGAEMQGMLARIAGRDSAVQAYQTMEHTGHDFVPPWNWADVDFHTSVYNIMAYREAQYLELQIPLITGDESKAADHVIGAVNGC